MKVSVWLVRNPLIATWIFLAFGFYYLFNDSSNKLITVPLTISSSLPKSSLVLFSTQVCNVGKSIYNIKWQTLARSIFISYLSGHLLYSSIFCALSLKRASCSWEVPLIIILFHFDYIREYKQIYSNYYYYYLLFTIYYGLLNNFDMIC
jgi:hypothetical protein